MPRRLACCRGKRTAFGHALCAITQAKAVCPWCARHVHGPKAVGKFYLFNDKERCHREWCMLSSNQIQIVVSVLFFMITMTITNLFSIFFYCRCLTVRRDQALPYGFQTVPCPAMLLVCGRSKQPGVVRGTPCCTSSTTRKCQMRISCMF